MFEDQVRIGKLITKVLEENIHPEEMAELDAWRNESPCNQAVYDELTNPYILRDNLRKLYKYSEESESALHKILYGTPPVKNVTSIQWARLAAAIIILGIFISGILVYNKQTKRQILNDPAAFAWKNGDQLPATHAIITLPDGSKMPLDSAAIGVLATQEGVNIIKSKDGQVVLRESKNKSGRTLKNFIETGKGSPVEVILSDGSSVWLNSRSKLVFPNAFTGNTRIVSLSGEGYFEVVKDIARPFYVDIEGSDVRVTGTEFNIHVYGDEVAITSANIRSKIRFKSDDRLIDVKGGQQLQYDSTAKEYKLVIDTDFVPGDLPPRGNWKSTLSNSAIAAIPVMIDRKSKLYGSGRAASDSISTWIFGEMVRRL